MSDYDPQITCPNCNGDQCLRCEYIGFVSGMPKVIRALTVCGTCKGTGETYASYVEHGEIRVHEGKDPRPCPNPYCREGRDLTHLMEALGGKQLWRCIDGLTDDEGVLREREIQHIEAFACRSHYVQCGPVWVVPANQGEEQ